MRIFTTVGLYVSGGFEILFIYYVCGLLFTQLLFVYSLNKRQVGDLCLRSSRSLVACEHLSSQILSKDTPQLL